MRKKHIIKVNNPYFSPNFVEKNNQIKFLKSGTWYCSWVERSIKGFKTVEEFKKMPFKTKKEALKFETELLILFNK